MGPRIDDRVDVNCFSSSVMNTDYSNISKALNNITDDSKAILPYNADVISDRTDDNSTAIGKIMLSILIYNRHNSASMSEYSTSMLCYYMRILLLILIILLLLKWYNYNSRISLYRYITVSGIILLAVYKLSLNSSQDLIEY